MFPSMNARLARWLLPIALLLAPMAARAQYVPPSGYQTYLPLTGGALSGALTAPSATLTGSGTALNLSGGGINTTTGYQQLGLGTILQVYGNSGNTFGDGPGTDVLVGLRAGAALPTTDYLTTAVGWHALASSTANPTESTAVGWNSQGAITTGSQNTTLGVNTLGSCVACVHDLAIATDAMRNVLNTSGSGGGTYLIGIGTDALINTNDSYNIAIGEADLSGNSTSTGHDNIALGFNTMTATGETSASGNVALGNDIAASITSGANNTMAGLTAGQSLTSGSSNTLLGASAGKLITSAGNNTLLGFGAGSKVTTGGPYTIIGTNVGDTTAATGFGVILIGSGNVAVDTPTAGTSSYINVENIWTATGTNTPSTSVTTIAGILNSVGVYEANGTAGVTCTGSPTSSFASVGGIVTHC